MVGASPHSPKPASDKLVVPLTVGTALAVIGSPTILSHFATNKPTLCCHSPTTGTGSTTVVHSAPTSVLMNSIVATTVSASPHSLLIST